MSGSFQPDAVWASREIGKRLVTTVERHLARLESSDSPSDSEHFELWYSLGRLKLDPWRGLPKADLEQLRPKAQTLEERLRHQLSLRGSPLRAAFFRGLGEVLLKLSIAVREARSRLERGELGVLFTSYEFEHDIMDRRDRLGFAIGLTANLEAVPPSEVTKKIKGVDESLRELLPEARKRFRDLGHPIDESSDQFPKEFWWRT